MAERRGGDRRRNDRGEPSGSRPAYDRQRAGQWATVARGVQAVQQSFAEGIEAVGLSLPYYSVLTLLLDAEDHRLPMSRIARDLAMTTGGFTKLADRMGRDGLIDRRGSAGDRRVVFAALTDAGCEAAARARTEYQRLLQETVLGVISATELATMAASAQRLADAQGGADPEPQIYPVAAPEPGRPDRRRRPR